ncbi:MAG TPA: undecaprenyldiphospho-muramoylpentapeptide beta-N-acetylglucosaminyltransferase [Clostridia bacterium]|nr:undecaprenyldiphospho-muramoylpentapeptide beta-N-acetylglucosaminyltransferase [Clostridia bacterium]
MKILFAGGGTAGHINPAIAVASFIRRRYPDADIRFAGTPSGMESKLVPKAGFRIYPIEIRGFRRKISLYNLGTIRRLATSFSRADRILKDFQPDVVVGTGGYVSGPVLYRAAKRKIPTVIHEQNSFPGVTSKILSRYADQIMIASEDAAKYLKHPERITVTGNPVREEIVGYPREKARRELGMDERPVILSFGGSLGARTMNQAIADLMELDSKSARYQHIHAAGSYGWGWMPALLREKGVNVKAPGIRLSEYIHDMPRCLAAADLVICRCGAITLSELQVLGKPSILIPSPNVAENHQYHNGGSMEKRCAAILIEDDKLSGKLLMEKIDQLFSHPGRLEKMSRASLKMAIPDANERIFKVVRSVLKM